MFGPDLLVAPVMEAGVTQRQVYLPAGAKWTNAWTCEVFEGGQTITVDAPLSIIPLFLRDGAICQFASNTGVSLFHPASGDHFRQARIENH
jgi:alpha-glucosidase (family GH31 glycosyl hydrolase)